MDLELVIDGCIKHDRFCQKQLYDYSYAYGMKIILAYCNNSEEARELLNDSFLKMFSSIEQYDASRPFLPWFRVIIVRTAINHYHKARKYMKTIEISDDFQDFQSINPDAISNLEVEEILKMTAKLPPSYKMVLNLFAIEGYTHEEIASLLDISIGTSKSNLFKARAFIQKLISKSNFLILF